MIRTSIRLALVFALVLAAPNVFAQAPAAQTPPANDDAALKPAEPDFTLLSLPTALRLPKWGSAFHLTHRFSLPLNNTDAGEIFGRIDDVNRGTLQGLPTAAACDVAVSATVTPEAAC